MRAPTNNRVTQGKHGTYNAVDYSWSPDPNIYAPENGTISFYANAGSCGNNLQMVGASGTHGFCHLERKTVGVGQKVTKGQVIGVMGYTGYTIPSGPNGRHLHWVLRKGNTYVYPPNYVNEPFKPVTKPIGDDMITTKDQAIKLYKMLRPNGGGSTAEINGTVGRRTFTSFLNDAQAEIAARDKGIKSLQSQLADVKKALANEKAKPPKEVVKVVEKIVEKEVPTGAISPEDSAAIKETNNLMRKLMERITSIFK